ncbi:MAG: aminoacyl-tRNA hydrolase [Planctomycetota bacterium]
MPSPLDDLAGNPCLVVGLGNPGTRYRFTRHNAGYMAVDRLIEDKKLEWVTLGSLGILALGKVDQESFEPERHDQEVEMSFCALKPLTYMNRSGMAVGDCVDRARIPFENLLVISDDFNLPVGRIRFRKQGSAGGHNGLKSIIRTLGTDAFSRLRIGVGPLPRGANIVNFVLDEFSEPDLDHLDQALNRACEAVQVWIRNRDIDLCMNRFNRFTQD